MTIDELPRVHKRALLRAFHHTNSPTIWNPGWYPVANMYRDHREVYETPTEKWLTKTFGIHSDSPIFEIGNSFKVKFSWYTQQWLVSA